MNGNIDLIRQVLDSGPIAIAVGPRPDLDQMAAALSLYLALSGSGKNVSIVSSSDPLVEVSDLVGIDKVGKAFQAGSTGDLTVSFPYKEGEIDKISYTLDQGFLNIIVKASQQGLTFSQKDVVFKRTGDSPSVIFAVGVQKLSELTTIFNLDSLKNTTIINIDNKPDNQGFGEILLVNPGASSLSEEVANIILGLDLVLDIDSSQNILSGISFATQNFTDPKTSALSFEMAAIMMRNGARRIQRKERPNPPQSFGTSPNLQRQPLRQDRPQRGNPVPNFSQAPTSQDSQSQANYPVQNFNQNNQNSKNRGNITREYQKENTGESTPPGDWLAPKIFKGSTNVG